jgi:hypothetical protein
MSESSNDLSNQIKPTPERQSYSQMTDEQKLEVLITEMKRDESDMRFKITDRFVFDEKVPWRVHVFSRARYTMIVIPFFVFVVLTIFFGVTPKFIKVVSVFGWFIFGVVLSLPPKKLKDEADPYENSWAAYSLELFYRGSMLSNLGCTWTFFFKNMIFNFAFCFSLGLFIFSGFIPLFFLRCIMAGLQISSAPNMLDHGCMRPH